jgi:hypothetical protein
MAPWKLALLSVVMGFPTSSKYLKRGIERAAGGTACVTVNSLFREQYQVKDLKSVNEAVY